MDLIWYEIYRGGKEVISVWSGKEIEYEIEKIDCGNCTCNSGYRKTLAQCFVPNVGMPTWGKVPSGICNS